ncbi:MAG TPA: type II secretion system minor pseudopilin GspJ [Gammaproteobacteria bacterium]|nr:type II secretion system minor pseudopilin GspJ [Gammaproteobacteria bacterium]
MHHSNKHLPARDDSGFTLLELLVALSIFAVLATMAYGGLRSVLDTRARAQVQTAQLAELQLAFTFIERDLEQILARGIRDSFGDPQPPIRGVEEGTPLLEFTRNGWRNPAAQARSTLQRVAYRVQEHRLLRSAWPVLDQAQTSKPQDTVLIEKINTAEVRFVDKELAAQRAWPIAERSTNVTQVLPRAIEFTIDIEGWGRITRLFRIVESAQ